MARFPIGLTISMIVATVTVGCFIIAFSQSLGAATDANPAIRLMRASPFLVHWACGMCLGWSLLATLVTGQDTKGRLDSPRREAVEVLNVATMVCALIAGIVMVYVAGMEVLLRTMFYQFDRTVHVIDFWSFGLIDLAALATALLLSWLRHRHPTLITLLFWTFILIALWVAFVVPALSVRDDDWVIWFLLGASLVVAAFTLLEGYFRHHRRWNAWPDHLDHLLADPPAWPGFRLSAGIVAALSLVLGCLLLYHPAIFFSTLLCGICMLVLVGRKWEANLADAGLALITLAVTCIFMRFMPDHALQSPDTWFPEVFNRALLSLSIMCWFWYWLASVWKQQLDEGRAWTTSGRMIFVTERVGYLVGATAGLMGMHLAVWPLFPNVIVSDAETYRWIEGSIGYVLLFGALATSAKRTGKETLAWFVLIAAASAIIFAMVRRPHAAVTQIWAANWPLLLAVIGLLALLLSIPAAVSKTRRVFAFPLMMTGAFIAPAMAAVGVTLMRSNTRPDWLPVATMAVLAVLYLVASWRPGPRLFMGVSGICASLSLIFFVM